MVLDINLFRKEKGGNPEKIKESERNRFHDDTIVDKVIEFDEKWRKCIFQVEELKKEINAVNKEIGNRKKADRKANVEDLIKKSLSLKEELPILENEEKYLLKQRNSYLAKVGNVLNSKVVVSKDEVHNKVVKTWGVCKKFRIEDSDINEKKECESSSGNTTIGGSSNGKLKYYHHFDLLLKIGGANFKKGIQVAGHRGYYLTGMGFLLHNAILQYALQFLVQKKYTPIYTPFFMRKNVMEECAELDDFEETLYKIPMNVSGKSEGNTEEQDRDDLFLIATSEQPLCALNKDETLESRNLPLRYVGFSSCFRKEAGAHGKDIRGIFRVHQFEKIEQFCVSLPQYSNKIHKEMMEICEEFYQSLEIPYRIISIVSGALNNAAAIKYDLEGHFPSFDKYRELVSCSNCTDYQSINLNIRYTDSSVKIGDKKDIESTNPNQEQPDAEYQEFKKDFQTENKNFVHLLNGTVVAAQRCLCCILENYQNGHGIVVPEKLRPYMNNMDFIPFIN